jgi:glycosyltransferase involved in cell wall biosynthesis
VNGTITEAPLALVCIEPHFPGRLGATADWLVRRRGYRCHFYCATTDPPAHWPPSAGRGLEVVRFNVGGVARESAVPWSRSLERALCYAYGCFEVLDARRPRPVDLVLGRSDSLGSTLFAPVSLPGVPVVNLFDYWLAPHANDLTGDMGLDVPPEYFHWRRTAHAYDLLELESAAGAWTHTAWQRDLFPPEYRDAFTVLHDGVDVPADRRGAAPRTVAGRAVPDGVRVVSFVARFLDQLRGFDRFVTLANRLLAARRDLLFVVVGEPVVRRALDVRHHNQDYRQVVLSREPLADAERFWFLGRVPPAKVAEVFAVSDLHVYPSRPYPVARSLLEAMAAGRVVLAWDTDPVREVLTHGQSGLLVSADPDAAAREAGRVLDDPAAHRPLGEAAAALVRQRYDRDVTLPRLAAWLARLAGGRD